MRLRCRQNLHVERARQAQNALNALFSKSSLATISVLTAFNLFLVPAFAAPGADDGASTSSASSTSSMSERIKKYTGEDESESGGGLPADRMQRVRDKLMQMPPEQREKMMQQVRERRAAKRGLKFGADGGPDGAGPPPDGMGPDGGPPGGPPDGGPGGFRRPKNFAGGPSIKGGKFFGREPLDLTKLNLSAEQKTKIQTMRSANGQKARALHADLKQRREKFREMLFDPNATNDDILSMRREVNKLQTQVEDLMLTDFLGIRKLLTKEQMELLPSIRPEEPPRRMAKPRRKTGDSEISGRGGDS